MLFGTVVCLSGDLCLSDVLVGLVECFAAADGPGGDFLAV